ncbi:MAG: hypothetical protein JWO58_2608 [Chitinophagaceae bacterium]|nr:hypothetical protein [Chitinophagaceae bacterium]
MNWLDIHRNFQKYSMDLMPFLNCSESLSVYTEIPFTILIEAQ